MVEIKNHVIIKNAFKIKLICQIIISHFYDDINVTFI